VQDPRGQEWYDMVFRYIYIQMMLCFSHQHFTNFNNLKVSYLYFMPQKVCLMLFFTNRMIFFNFNNLQPIGQQNKPLGYIASYLATIFNFHNNKPLGYITLSHHTQLYYSKSGPYRQDILNCLINESILYWINDQRINTISLLPIANLLSFAKRQR
jgi:hypothetical protein